MSVEEKARIEEARKAALAKFEEANFDQFVPPPIAGGMRFSFNSGFSAALEAMK